MAYMNQEKKAKIAAELKKVVPSDWKYTLRVQHHSTIIMTIKSAPVDLLADFKWYNDEPRNYATLMYLNSCEFTGETLEVMTKALAALNLDNYDLSDSMTDYFCVGHYVRVNIGEYNKPFVCTAPKAVATKEVPVESILDAFAMKFTRNFNAALAR